MSVITARWIVGFFCTMFMLVTIISGIVIHKRILNDFLVLDPERPALLARCPRRQLSALPCLSSYDHLHRPSDPDVYVYAMGT